MNKEKTKTFFDRLATYATKKSGSPAVFVIACSIILIWLITGPIFKFSDTWQLVINTFTSIVTFLMVFIIQQTQNKDTMALQLKINELIAANKNASNRLIDIEDLRPDELEVLKKFYINLSELAEKEKNMHLTKTHSADEAGNIHKLKLTSSKKH